MRYLCEADIHSLEEKGKISVEEGNIPVSNIVQEASQD